MASVTGTSQHDSLLGSDEGDTLLGFAGADTLTGGSAADVLLGGDGNDSLSGNAGNDSLNGNQGNDILFGGEGGDTLYGGQGDDTLTGGSNTTIAVVEDGVTTYRNSALVNDDSLSGDLGNDLLQGTTGLDSLFGGDGNDTLRGGRDGDLAYGGTGDDRIHGDKGNDTLNGNQGSDVLEGGAGNDELHGGQGDDILIGGDGSDTLYGDLSGVSGDTIFTGNGDDLIIIRLNDPTPVFGLRTPHALQAGSTEIVDFSNGDRIQFQGGTVSSVQIANSPTNTSTDFSTIVTVEGMQFILYGVTASQVAAQNTSQGSQIIFAGTTSGGGSSGGGGGGPPVNSAPVLTDVSATTAYTQNAAATVIDGSATITDTDDTNIESAEVWISAGGDFVAGGGIDALNFTNQNGITGSYDANTGILTLTGTATKAHYETAIESVTFSSTSGTSGDRTISFKVNDGDVDSNTQTATITYSLAGNPPINSVPAAQTFNEDASRTFSVGNGNLISVSDTDNVSLTAYTLTVSHGALTLSQTTGLAFTTGDGTSDTTMTFSGTITDINAALAGLVYTPTANYNGTDTISVLANDGTLTDSDSITLNITAQNDAPVNSVPGAQTFNEDVNRTFSVGNGNLISVSDVDNTSLTAYTIAVSHGTLSLSQTTGLAFTTGDGTSDATMTFSGTVADINAALAGLVYAPTANYNGTDTITATANDGTATDNDTITLNITSVNDAPVNSVPAAQTFNEDISRTFSTGNGNLISVSDLDHSSLTAYTIAVTNGVLSLSQTTGLAFTTGDGTSDATMTFSGTITNINAALDGLVYTPTADYAGTDTISITANDGTNSDNDSIQLNLTAINDAPVLAGITGGNLYTEAGSHLVIDSTITLTDVDDTNIESATIAITNNFVSGDQLEFTNQNGISGSYDSLTGTLALTGSATKANYETALESIQFYSTSIVPTTATRTVSFTINDGNLDSTTQTATVNVTDVLISSTAFSDLESLANNAWAGLNSAAVTSHFSSPYTITYSLSVTDITGAAYVGFTIDANTGAIAHTGNLPNANQVYVLTVTGTDQESNTSQTFELWDHVGALTYTGTTGNDTPAAGAGARWGNDGNDSLSINAINATVHGGSGTDTIANTSSGGVDYGGSGNDSLSGTTSFGAADTLYGGSGDDTLVGNVGTDSLTGGTGVDYFAYRSLADSTAASRDTISDFSQSDGDKLWVQNSFDKIYAGTGTAATDSVIAGFEVGNLVWYQSGGNTFVYDPTGATTFSIQLTGLISLTSTDFIFAGASAGQTGTAGNDTINGSAAIIGMAGDDSLTAAAGTLINGGDGNDTLSGSGSNSNIYFGGAGNDSISDINIGNLLHGGSGNDSLAGNTGADTLTGGTGIDYFTYQGLTDSTAASRDTISDFSQSDGDQLWIRNGFDKIITGGTGTAATDSVLAGFEVGNLVTYQSGGNTFVYDPTGVSTFSIQLTGLIALTSGDFTFAGTAASLTGTAGNDTLSGITGGGVIGLAGDDSISVTSGGTTINGGDGNDTITNPSGATVAWMFGATGNDSISGNGNSERYYGGSGNDTLQGGGGADTLTGGTGIDYFDYRGLGDSLVAGRDTITDFSQGDGDQLWIRNGFDKIITGGTGTAATDSVLAGFEVGNLVTYQSGGNTFVYDPSGASTFSIQLTGLISLTAADFIFAGTAATLTGTAGNDTFSTTGSNIIGLAGDDSISVTGISNGGDGNDTLVALTFQLQAYGGAGNDSIVGGGGSNARDTLYGGSGNDTISGGGGGYQDLLTGGTGGDYFTYVAILDSSVAARDTIADFNQGDGDQIWMKSGFDKIYAGDGTANDTAIAGIEVGNLVTYQSGGNTFVYDPSGVSTFSIQLTGLSTLTSADFIFAGSTAGNTGTAGGDTISGSGGIAGMAGNDSLTTTSTSTVNGGDGNDTISGSNHANFYFGGAGTDSISTGTVIDTIQGGTGADTIRGSTGADNIYAGPSDTAADQIQYAATTDGAAAGANTGFDTISHFEVGTDKIAFASTLNTNFDDISNNDVIAWQTNAAANFTATHEALLITGLADVDLTQASFTTILAALNGYGITAASGADAIIAIQGTTQTAFFLYTENGTLANNIVAGELTLLGVTNGQLTTADFIFA